MDQSAASVIVPTANLGQQTSLGGRQPMLIAEATVETERSSRYLVQLCQHVSKVGRAHAQMQAEVEWSEDRGLIDFEWGRCTLHAAPGVLTLRAEAPDEDSLRRIEQRVADRLERIGRHDHLTVTWTPPQSAGQGTVQTPASATEGTSGPTHGGHVRGPVNHAEGREHPPE